MFPNEAINVDIAANSTPKAALSERLNDDISDETAFSDPAACNRKSKSLPQQQTDKEPRSLDQRCQAEI